MRDGEDSTQQDAEPADDNVGDAEENVLTSNDGARTDYDGLGATIFVYREVCMLSVYRVGEEGKKRTQVNVERVGALGHLVCVVPLRKLAENWKTSETHPDLEGLIIYKIWMVIIAVPIWIT